MMHLVIILEAEVEDVAEATAKAKAVHDVIKVYPFVKMSATINDRITIPQIEGEPT